MTGYKEDTLITVLRKGEDIVEEQQIKISEINKVDTDFVKMLHIPTLSVQYLPAKISVGEYEGKLFVFSFEETEQEFYVCENQKLFIGTYSNEFCSPIFDEKLLSEVSEKDYLIQSAGFSVEYERDMQRLPIEEYAAKFDDKSRSKFSYRKLTIKDIKETTYKGKLYNLINSIEYVTDSNRIMITLMHE